MVAESIPWYAVGPDDEGAATVGGAVLEEALVTEGGAAPPVARPVAAGEGLAAHPDAVAATTAAAIQDGHLTRRMPPS